MQKSTIVECACGNFVYVGFDKTVCVSCKRLIQVNSDGAYINDGGIVIPLLIRRKLQASRDLRYFREEEPETGDKISIIWGDYSVSLHREWDEKDVWQNDIVSFFEPYAWILEKRNDV